MPSQTNSGATTSSTLSRVSATRRRIAGVRRSRRMRRAGKLTPSWYGSVPWTFPEPGRERLDQAVEGVLGRLHVDPQTVLARRGRGHGPDAGDHRRDHLDAGDGEE